jgi:Fur family transcriptional regulator, ferric uptake regulator
MAPARPTDWADHTRDALEQAGYRSGGARLAVIDFLARQQCCLSAQEIADGVRAQGGTVGIASVYRALELLDELDLVQRLDSEGVTRFEPAHPSGEHHHHIVCDSCGRVTAFADEALEHTIDRLADRLDYAVGGHDVVLRGECPRCRAAA